MGSAPIDQSKTPSEHAPWALLVRRMLETPVALIIFRRPDFAARVIAEIAKVKPRKLLIIADGPSPSRLGEAEKCAAARAVIDRDVNWDCEVLKFYSDVNLGVETWLAKGMNWVFEQCEEAIILEDDDVPHPSFFPFCAEMLERYRNDERVMLVNGTSLQLGRSVTPHSYYFSRYFHCWGFASWRRAWKHYDVKIAGWPALRQTQWLSDIFAGNEPEAAYFADTFDRMLAGKIPTWDYQVSFMMWANSGLAISPDVNLISNIGHGEGIGLYSQDPNIPFAFLPLKEMQFPLRHPPHVLRDLQADRYEYQNNIEPVLKLRGKPLPLKQRLRNAASRSIPKPVKRLLKGKKR